MHLNTQQTGFALLMALLSTSALATPMANISPIELQTRAPADYPNAILYWADTDFKNTWYAHTEDYGQFNRGNCYSMKLNFARSARAPEGWKCTIYSDLGCLGWRTREFNHDGINDLGQKMNANGEAWRCCKIGTTNYWGYCDAKLNEGTR